MYMPPVVGKMKLTPQGTPVVDLTPSHQKRVVESQDSLLEAMMTDPYKSELTKLFDQYRALQEIRAAPGLSSKKIGIMMREGKIIDLRVSNTSEYRAYTAGSNGVRTGTFALINLIAPRPNSGVSRAWRLVRSGRVAPSSISPTLPGPATSKSL